PDGKVLLYGLQSPETKDDLWTVPVSGEIKPAPYLRGPFDEVQGRFSPDGRWVAYASNESGQFEVYVQSFPAGQGKWQISTSGGADPRWRRDGKELYFISPDRKIMAIDVTTSPAFEPKIARPLFPAAVSGMTDVRTHYAVTHDGQRFLVNKLLDTSGSTPLTVVLNWTATLKK
ncbi:MAG: PD40 domain-containing protein, partial [Acidobacteria bacterium]|nr:PD40 domain-containing protein [Acidobacteriota bacterium]